MHSLHQCYLSRKPPDPIIDVEEEEEHIDRSERAKLLVHQHFGDNVNPFELLVRRRIHERYKN